MTDTRRETGYYVFNSLPGDGEGRNAEIKAFRDQLDEEFGGHGRFEPSIPDHMMCMTWVWTEEHAGGLF